ncbi:hypothetical protein FRC03_007406 [Tulasnella sp. 419]|nr:hypothetical protein FRC03_007406 [Tulasnella sp. 419]
MLGAYGLSKVYVYIDITKSKSDPPMVCYRLKNDMPIGCGHYGSVFHCEDDNGLEIAVKQLKPDVGINTSTGLRDQKSVRDRYRLRLLREYNIWRNLRHRNIAPLIGYAVSYERDGPMCLVTRYYKNGSLYWYRRGLALEAKLHLLQGAARGLEYLHTKNIVHHDVKASNVVIDDEGVPLLIDFGVSFDRNRQDICSSSFTSAGRQWLSPERVLWRIYSPEDNRPKTSADVWSFGCMVLEVVSEKDPWIRYSEDHNMLTSVMRPEYQEKPGTPAEYPTMTAPLWDLCEKCWNYQEDRRPRIKEVRRQVEALEGKSTRRYLPRLLSGRF